MSCEVFITTITKSVSTDFCPGAEKTQLRNTARCILLKCYFTGNNVVEMCHSCELQELLVPGAKSKSIGEAYHDEADAVWIVEQGMQKMGLGGSNRVLARSQPLSKSDQHHQ